MSDSIGPDPLKSPDRLINKQAHFLHQQSGRSALYEEKQTTPSQKSMNVENFEKALIKKPLKKEDSFWKRLMMCITRNNSLSGKFTLFICILFAFYYVVYVSLLIPFIRYWFTNRTLRAIETEFSNQSNQRQLNVIRNIANGLNFFLLNQNTSLTKMNRMMTDIMTLSSRFDIHPLNWQSVNDTPQNMTEAQLGSQQSVGFAVFQTSKTVGGLNPSGYIYVNMTIPQTGLKSGRMQSMYMAQRV